MPGFELSKKQAEELASLCASIIVGLPLAEAIWEAGRPWPEEIAEKVEKLSVESRRKLWVIIDELKCRERECGA